MMLACSIEELMQQNWEGMNVLTKELLGRMLAFAVADLNERSEELNRLDAATGDGDHGTSICRAMQAAARAATASGTLKETLYNVGWAAECEDCGSTSTLTGSFYQGMSDAVSSETLDCDAVITMFSAGLAGLRQATAAQCGDKTLMDALIPAIHAMESFRERPGTTLVALFQEAATAAKTGAESTRDCVAKFGRAKNLGERTRGRLDPGAVGISIIFDAFRRAVSM